MSLVGAIIKKARRKRWTKAKSGPEHEIQKAYIWWCRNVLKHPVGKRVYAIPNNAPADRDQMRYYLEEGLNPGTPDICVPCKSADGHSGALYIEFKAGQNGPSDKQMVAINELYELENSVCVCYSLAEGQRATLRHLGL